VKPERDNSATTLPTTTTRIRTSIRSSAVCESESVCYELGKHTSLEGFPSEETGFCAVKTAAKTAATRPTSGLI
jgi:hypothetical protein